MATVSKKTETWRNLRGRSIDPSVVLHALRVAQQHFVDDARDLATIQEDMPLITAKAAALLAKEFERYAANTAEVINAVEDGLTLIVEDEEEV